MNLSGVLTSIAMLVCAISFSSAAEYHNLVSKNGQSIKAELVSHSAGKVTIRREDGKEFEVDPAIFCKQDHEALMAWMKTQPEKINYDFEIEADKKMGNRESYGEGSTHTHWFYEVKVRNDAQATVKGIRVLYRIVYETDGNQRMLEGEHLLEQDLDFNRTLILKTESIGIYRSRECRDNGIKGCLVRILDPKGEVAATWISRDVGMKNVSWESLNPRNDCEPENKIEIR